MIIYIASKIEIMSTHCGGFFYSMFSLNAHLVRFFIAIKNGGLYAINTDS